MHSFPPQLEAFNELERPAPNAAYSSQESRDLRIDLKSPLRFLMWCLRREWQPIALNALLGILWLAPSALSPYLLGRAIDVGIVGQNFPAAVPYLLIMLGLVVLAVVTGAAQGWLSMTSWLNTSLGTVKLVSRKTGQMGHVLSRRVPTGEVLSVGSSDVNSFGAVMEVTGEAISNIFGIILVSVIVLNQSVPLGLMMLFSSPMLVVISAPLFKPLQRSQASERSRSSKLTGMATDIVAGLRILRGIGGERIFGDNYAKQSQHTKQAGILLGTWMALVMAITALMSGLLLITLTWMGVEELLDGKLSIGQLVSFFGYATFLVRPMQSLFEFAQRWITALVSARKTIAVLSSEVPWRQPSEPHSWQSRAVIVDQESGVSVEPGKMTVLVSKIPDESSGLVYRIGRYLPSDELEPESLNLDEGAKGRKARDQRYAKQLKRQAKMDADRKIAEAPWGVTVAGVDMTSIPLDEVRQNILVSEPNAMVFAGTLQSFVDPHHTHSRQQAEDVIRAASAVDVYHLMRGGWQGQIDERGRDLSGGQRQRLVLARALLQDPEVLALIEPTSAVDAHTEAVIAKQVAEFRRGKTTLVTTVSPLWLAAADKVCVLVDGQQVAAGNHHELLETSAVYRQIVVRDADLEDVEDDQTGQPKREQVTDD